MRLGFIGLGNIGAPMARRYLRPEFELTVHDNHAEALRPFEDTGARLTTSCADLVQSSQVIAVCVRDDVDLLAVRRPSAILASRSRCAAGGSSTQPSRAARISPPPASSARW